ncbi:hypothetical protein VYU27_005865 [Nannochloropsis oceanica]
MMRSIAQQWATLDPVGFRFWYSRTYSRTFGQVLEMGYVDFAKETFTSIMDALKLMVRHAISTFTELVLEAHERGEVEFVQMLIISAADELEVSHAEVKALKDPMLLLDILQAKHHHNPFAWGESCLLLGAMTMGNLDLMVLRLNLDSVDGKAHARTRPYAHQYNKEGGWSVFGLVSIGIGVQYEHFNVLALGDFLMQHVVQASLTSERKREQEQEQRQQIISLPRWEQEKRKEHREGRDAALP